MKNDVCLCQSPHLQEAFSEPDCAIFHLATCFMCLEWKCTKSHSPAGDKGPCHTRQLGVQILSLGLFHCSSNCPLSWAWQKSPCKMGSCSKITGAQGHCVQILYLCTMLWIPWVTSASRQCCPAWYAPARALQPAGKSIAAFVLTEPCPSLQLSQLYSFGPSRLSQRVISTAESKPRK